MQLHGIHHLTAVTADARGNHDFYTRVLGMRLEIFGAELEGMVRLLALMPGVGNPSVTLPSQGCAVSTCRRSAVTSTTRTTTSRSSSARSGARGESEGRSCSACRATDE